MPRTRYKPPKQVTYDAGPFKGMRDSLDPASADPAKAFLLQNCYPLDSERNYAVVGRPGFQQAGSQLGGGSRVGQLVFQFTKLAGTEITLSIVGGKLYTFNWGTRVWTESVTAANFATASITLDANANVYGVTFTDCVVFSDGVNVPWKWDGTAGAAGLTKLTSCPVLYGQPVVYYAKLFGIKATERSTFVWSEENDATIGYEAGGYNNAWELGQTDQEPLNVLVPTNAALYYFRSRSVGVIQGAVNDDFQTSGVHDSVSSVAGSQSPGACVYYDGKIVFLDANFTPYVLTPGSGVTTLWGDLKETIGGLDRQYVTSATGIFDRSTFLILLGVVETGQSIPSALLVIDPDATTGPAEPIAIWRGFTFQAMATVKNSSGQPLVMHLSNDGYAYDHGLPGGILWSDAFNAGTQAITHIVEPSAMGNDVEIEKLFTRLDMTFRTTSPLTNVGIAYETTRTLAASTPVTPPSLTGAFSLWDTAVWDTNSWSAVSVDQHLAVGLNAQGRWIKPIVRHSTAGEQFGLSTMRVTAVPLNIDPSVP